VPGARRATLDGLRSSRTCGWRCPAGPATATCWGLIRRVLEDSPFAGEGYRKVRARLRREHGVHVSGKRVLRLLRRRGP
jgi:putative transposase